MNYRNYSNKNYKNYKSHNSDTVLSNRIGDVGSLITIGFMIIRSRWDTYIIDARNNDIYVTILLAAITKRAQISFPT